MGATVLGAPRAANPLASSKKRRGGSIPLAPSSFRFFMNGNEKNIVIGTAGHIDHGKTMLVKSLTGIDTERLKEEKERGMTIEPGFTHLKLPSKTVVSVVDVPGHERFIKNMLRGISGIDIAILVIASDDGVMPQTYEHLDILKLLNIQYGLIVISKIDLVDEELLNMAVDEAKNLAKGTFLENAPIIPFSAKTKKGLDKILKTIDDITSQITDKNIDDIFRMPIDRVFTMPGHGTIVTGTIASGKIKTGDTVEIYPISKTTNIRNIQIHNKLVAEAIKGHRVGINISGTKADEIKRGMVLGESGSIQSTHIINVQFHYLQSNKNPISDRMKIRFYSGTSEVVGRMVFIDKKRIDPGETCFVQIRLEELISPLPYDRYVIRTLSPMKTIGGGIILEVNPKKYRSIHTGLTDYLITLERRNISKLAENLILQERFRPLTISELIKKTHIKKEEALSIWENMVQQGIIITLSDDSAVHRENMCYLKKTILEKINEFHTQNPHIKDMSQEDIRSKISQNLNQKLYETILKGLSDEDKIENYQGRIKLAGFKVRLDDEKMRIYQFLDRMCKEYKFRPMPLNVFEKIKERFGEKEVDAVLKTMIGEGKLIRLNNNRLIHSDAIDEIKKILLDYLHKNNKVTLAGFVDVIGLGRTQIQPIFDYLDSIRFTMRIGDYRVLYKGAKKNHSG